MTNHIKQLVAEELQNPSFFMTGEYLKVLQPLYKNGLPQVIKVDIDNVNAIAKAYVVVKDESFYLLFLFDIEKEVVLSCVETAPFVRISYTAVSKELELEDLLGLTTVLPTTIIKKGEKCGRGFEYDYNGLEFVSTDDPADFLDKLAAFLDVLETDSEGIKHLSEKTLCHEIFVTIIYHNDVASFTGLWLESVLMKRLSELNLGLTFDIYPSGKRLYSGD
ncbi:DUF4279 domain-containing protein [Flavobacterium sp. RHBU_3]|uniref:DUF4279 domain-containing protein n=1 Tax=Flavobacterium sp. RHBU_3 TaxID=3391184 RepID=UPI0039849607